jgi:hypothetical protein
MLSKAAFTTGPVAYLPFQDFQARQLLVIFLLFSRAALNLRKNRASFLPAISFILRLLNYII